MKRIIQSSKLGLTEVANVTPPNKDSRKFTATCNGVAAQGDTIEEACDNLSGAVFGPTPGWL